MPQKACERCIFHVRPYANFFEMPQIRTLPVFLFEISSRGFYMFEKFDMPHLRVIVFENGAFQIFRA